jgi:hypothetical protein
MRRERPIKRFLDCGCQNCCKISNADLPGERLMTGIRFIKAFFRLTILLNFLMSGPFFPAAAEELTVHSLENGKYFVPSWENPDLGEWVQLKNGEYNRQNPDDPLSVKIVALATGYLSNQKTEDAAVIYGFSKGGTGFFVMLCAVINDHGKLKNSNLVDLEDRVEINSLNIKSGKIIVDMLAHRANDPAPFPTLKKIVQYGLIGNKLVEISPANSADE